MVAAQNIVGEATQAGEDAGVDADAGSVFIESNIAGVVATVFDAPMSTNGFGREARSNGLRR